MKYKLLEWRRRVLTPEEIVFNVIREKWTFYFSAAWFEFENVSCELFRADFLEKYRSTHAVSRDTTTIPIRFEEEIDCWFKNEKENCFPITFLHYSSLSVLFYFNSQEFEIKIFFLFWKCSNFDPRGCTIIIIIIIIQPVKIHTFYISLVIIFS